MSDVIVGVSSSSHTHQHDCSDGHEQVFATVLRWRHKSGEEIHNSGEEMTSQKYDVTNPERK
jgi:hypothetical protein